MAISLLFLLLIFFLIAVIGGMVAVFLLNRPRR
jgi:hypothetical protein